jgi:hypothetical protein
LQQLAALQDNRASQAGMIDLVRLLEFFLSLASAGGVGRGIQEKLLEARRRNEASQGDLLGWGKVWAIGYTLKQA